MKAKSEQPTEVCATCGNKGWYFVGGWPTVCTACKVASPSARRAKLKELMAMANVKEGPR